MRKRDKIIEDMIEDFKKDALLTVTLPPGKYRIEFVRLPEFKNCQIEGNENAGIYTG